MIYYLSKILSPSIQLLRVVAQLAIALLLVSWICYAAQNSTSPFHGMGTILCATPSHQMPHAQPRPDFRTGHSG